jgi:nucleoside 2-deoxyribosyltransferase
MKAYLCGPINGCTDEECKDWREAAKLCLPDTLDPMRRDYRGRESQSYKEIVEGDKDDIRESDVLLVNYDKPSVGTSMEIYFAWLLGKPIIVVARPETVISPWLRYHSTKIVNSFEEAFSDEVFL